MSLSKPVEDAVAGLDAYHAVPRSISATNWKTIRAELHRLTTELEAANALLRDIAEYRWFKSRAPATTALIEKQLQVVQS